MLVLSPQSLKLKQKYNLFEINKVERIRKKSNK